MLIATFFLLARVVCSSSRTPSFITLSSSPRNPKAITGCKRNTGDISKLGIQGGRAGRRAGRRWALRRWLAPRELGRGMPARRWDGGAPESFPRSPLPEGG